MNSDREHQPMVVDVINTIALRRCEDHRHRLHYRMGAEVRSMSLAELDRRATNVALHLRRLGLRARDRVGVMAPNRVEWVVLDVAVLKLGGVTGGFEQGRYAAREIVHQYGLKLLFVEGDVDDEQVVNIDRVSDWSDGPNVGETTPLHGGYDPADICAIKFTSGSTGVPKGLEATVASVNQSISEIQRMFEHVDGDNILVFLRLALLQQRYWLYSALAFHHDVSITTIDDALPMAQAVSPTVIMGVPGFYEELKSRVVSTDDLAARRATLQAQLGGRVRYMWTGSAPASQGVLTYFWDASIPLYEGYGLNETCMIAKNHPKAYRLGSVGQIAPSKRIRFDKDGILIVGSRTPVNCRYTWCGPGANEKMFLATGEVKTYDMGYVDADGFLYIKGRVDDILTPSSGRNVLVRLVEERLREHHAVHDCVLYGTGKRFVSAVISPAASDTDLDALCDFVEELNRELLQEQRIHGLVIADEPFSLENGLLTSQFKQRRKEIHRRYDAELAAVYAKAEIFNGRELNMRPIIVESLARNTA